MVNHSDESYNCKEMSDCPYTGTTIINKIPWGDCPAGVEESERKGCCDVRNCCNIL